MSWNEASGPGVGNWQAGPISLSVVPRTVDLGEMRVHRLMPFDGSRLVGPFVFLDAFGPSVLPAGRGLDVRPHPHIGLSTLTYLYEGLLLHRDSMGHAVLVEPGDVNLMSAGIGVVHSERTPQDAREAPLNMAGLQAWLAHPREWEDRPPRLDRLPSRQVPRFQERGVEGHILAGGIDGLSSPLDTPSSTLYVDLHLRMDAQFRVPACSVDRALCIAQGSVEVDGCLWHGPQLLLLREGAEPVVRCSSPACRIALLGGEPLEGPRYLWWNFVASEAERIRDAAVRWEQEAFPLVLGDESDRIPLRSPLPEPGELTRLEAS